MGVLKKIVLILCVVLFSSNKVMPKKFFTGLAILLLFSSTAWSAIYYLDCDAKGANNGTSWTNAWKSFQDITGLNDGDIVYISAGSSGTKSYTLDSFGLGGNAPRGISSSITYKVGQDAGHNGGTAEFTFTGTYCIFSPSHMVISGSTGDGNRHFKFVDNQNKYIITDTTNALTDFKIEYVNFGQQSIGARVQGGLDFEISHCWFKKLENAATTGAWLLNGNATISDYDKILFHDNITYCPHIEKTGTGDDHVTSASRGISVYNNQFYQYIKNDYSAGQHCDGFQPGGGHYIKVYNNYYQDIGSYGIYLEAITGSPGYNHVRIFNNIFTHTEGVFTSGQTAAIMGIPKVNGITYEDVVIANNVVVDYVGAGASTAISLGDSTGNATFTDCYVVNNLSYNSGVIRQTDAAVNLSNNVDMDTNSSYFAVYTLYGGDSNDYHITSSATNLIDKGMDLSSKGITIDADSLSRPQGLWDIGAYEYSGGNTSMIGVYNAKGMSGYYNANGMGMIGNVSN